MKLKLTAGEHTLRIQNREDGIKVDQLLLCDDPGYVPVGVEETTVKPAAREKQ